MNITIVKEWKEKQIMALKELYELAESIRYTVTLLNEPYVRKITSDMIDIQNKLTEASDSIVSIQAYLDKTPY